MAFESVQVQSSRNGGGPVQGYREDLVGGDTLVVSLSDTRGVFSYLWEVVGRPEFGVAGGSGPNPWVLGYSPTAAFVVDSDSGSVHRDGSYKVACTINKGSPNETVVTTILCRVSGLTVPGPVGDLPLRKLAPFEALEDTSVGNLLAGWATQINRWLDHIMGISGGSFGPTQSWNPDYYYAPGSNPGFGPVGGEISTAALPGAGGFDWGSAQLFGRSGTITDIACNVGLTSTTGRLSMSIYASDPSNPTQPTALLHAFECAGGGFNTNFHEAVTIPVAAGDLVWFVLTATTAPNQDPLSANSLSVTSGKQNNYLGTDWDPAVTTSSIKYLGGIKKARTYSFPPPDPFPTLAAGLTDIIQGVGVNVPIFMYRFAQS